MNNCFLDIETICSDVMPSLDDIQAPANYKDVAKIDAWKRENQLELWKRQALDSMAGRIICVGYAWNDGEVKCITGGEHDIIIQFAELIYHSQESITSLPINFVGWNIQSFDLCWLWRKAIKYDFSELAKQLPKYNVKTVHQCTDLMRIFASDFKDFVSLDKTAQFLGIPHDTEPGSCVFDWWRSGETEKITEHCVADVETTRAIYHRMGV